MGLLSRGHSFKNLENSLKTVGEYLIELMDELELEISTAFSPDSGAQKAKDIPKQGQAQKGLESADN